jgi:hypothetical protein
MARESTTSQAFFDANRYQAHADLFSSAFFAAFIAQRNAIFAAKIAIYDKI